MDPESTGGGTCVCGVGGFDVTCCCALCGGSNPESHRRMSVRAGVCVSHSCRHKGAGTLHKEVEGSIQKKDGGCFAHCGCFASVVRKPHNF